MSVESPSFRSNLKMKGFDSLSKVKISQVNFTGGGC